MPLSEYLAYFQLLGIHGVEERSRLLSVVRRLDSQYVNTVNKKRKEEFDRRTSGSGRNNLPVGRGGAPKAA